LAPGADPAALHQAGTLLLSSVLEARPASSRRSGAKLPVHARVLPASALVSHATHGLGACGDLPRVWSAAGNLATPLLPQPLLPVQPWLVAGVLRCDAEGLRLECASGQSIQVAARDALAAMPLVDRAVLAQRWALPPSTGLPPVLEVHSFLPLDGLSAAVTRAPSPGEGCVAGAVVAVSPLLRIQTQTFCIAVRALSCRPRVPMCAYAPVSCVQELRGCGSGRVQHVFLDKDALRWRVALSSAAGRRCCVVLSGLTPRTLFPEQPERCWPVLVASASTKLSLHGCALPPAAAAGALCACDTCLRGDTVSMHAEVLEQELSDDGIAIRVRVGPGSCHAGREVPLLLAHHLSGTRLAHFACETASLTATTLAGAPSPSQLPGLRAGAEVLLLHAHPVLRQGVLLALGACSRTTLCLR
jgi:hypothetical protein